MQQNVFDLTDVQKQKFKALKKAYKDCIKAKMLPVNVYGSLGFYNSYFVEKYTNIDGFKDSENDCIIDGNDGSCIHFFSIEHEWTDDCGEHRVILTEKGKELFNDNQ